MQKPLKPPGKAGEHPAGKERIVIENPVDIVPVDPDDKTIVERLRIRRVGVIKKHQRLAERVAGPDEFDDLFEIVMPCRDR